MSWWSILRYPGLAGYVAVRFTVALAVQIQTVAVGWYLYEATRDPFYLGLVGLSQFLPALVLVLATGAVADRFPRRTVMVVCLIVKALCTLAILATLHMGPQALWAVFAALFGFGTARAFFNPAQQSLLPNLVPPEHLGSAIAVNIVGLKLGVVIGPLIGGILYAVSAELAFATAIAALAVAAGLMFLIPRPRQQGPATERRSLGALLAGFSYIRSQRIVLGAITLDLFTVLLGGVTALFPVYAADILNIGPVGLGFLVAAPAVGTVIVAAYLSVRPIRDHAGALLFASVAASAVTILVFGLSTIPLLSMVALVINGGADMVSVYLRHTLIQLWTPDGVRGRVSAVNAVVLDASNELGAFRAGTVAAVVGAVPAVVIGGVAMLAVTGIWRYLFPELRRIRSLTGLSEQPKPVA